MALVKLEFSFNLLSSFLLQKPFLPDNFMNNKTKQSPKINILSRLVDNSKKQDNFQNKISLCFDVTQHVGRAYRIIKPSLYYKALQPITKYTKWELKRLKQVPLKISLDAFRPIVISGLKVLM